MYICIAVKGAVFVHGDGLGINQFHRDSATVVLKGYQLDKAFQSKFSAGHGLTSPGTINFGDAYSIDTALVMVQVFQKTRIVYVWIKVPCLKSINKI